MTAVASAGPASSQAVCFPTTFFSRGSVKAILTDIEGTTTSIFFVKTDLFPYAKANLAAFLNAHREDEVIAKLIEEVKMEAGAPDADLNQVIAILQKWMDEDKKITPLKTLQGMMWKEGYENGTLKGHLYQDAFDQMNFWKKQGMPLYVFSSGSVQAQKLLFSHSTFGDSTGLFSGYFDTQMGTKKEKASYEKIAQAMNMDPRDVLFLSDITEELNAAKQAGFQTLLVCRDGILPNGQFHLTTNNFSQIAIQF